MAMKTKAWVVGMLPGFDSKKSTLAPTHNTVVGHIRTSCFGKQGGDAKTCSDKDTSPLPERDLLGESMYSYLFSPTASQTSTSSWSSIDAKCATKETVRVQALEQELASLKAENARSSDYLLWLENMIENMTALGRVKSADIENMAEMDRVKSAEIERLNLQQETTIDYCMQTKNYYVDVIKRMQDLNDKTVDKSFALQMELQSTNVALQESLEETNAMRIELEEKTVALKDVTAQLKALQKHSEEMNSFVDDILAGCKGFIFTCMKCSKKEEGKKDEHGYIKYCGNPTKYLCDECHKKQRKNAH